MSSHPPASGVFDTTLCVEDLRDALAVHGIKLPSLRVDLPSFAARYQPPAGLVALGNCNTATARRIAEVVRGAGGDSCLPPLDVEVLAAPEAVVALRRTVRRYLGAPCADVQLCVSELVTNVIRHVGDGTLIRVRVARADGGGLRVEVDDPDGSVLPARLAVTDDAEAEEGRGLLLIEALASRWGVEQRGSEAGKTMWCELAEVR